MSEREPSSAAWAAADECMDRPPFRLQDRSDAMQRHIALALDAFAAQPRAPVDEDMVRHIASAIYLDARARSAHPWEWGDQLEMVWPSDFSGLSPTHQQAWILEARSAIAAIPPPPERAAWNGPRPWERPIGDSEREERDLDLHPYTRQEQRIAASLSEVGGGDDPVGFMLTSCRYSAHALKTERAALRIAVNELRMIANINNGPDRASGEWRCGEAAAIAETALTRIRALGETET